MTGAMTGSSGGADGPGFGESVARFLSDGEPGGLGIGGKLSDQAMEIVMTAGQHTAALGIADVDTRHLLWAATQHDPARTLLSRAGADPDGLAAEATEAAPAGDPLDGGPELSPGCKQALLDSHRISRARGANQVGAEHLLIALAENRDSSAGRLLAAAETTPRSLERAATRGGSDAARVVPATSTSTSSSTPSLDRCSHDLTALARAGKLDPVIGREEQIEQIVEVLTRRTKNNPVLIGEPGVGKTSIVEGLARRVADGDIPDPIAGRRVLQLDLSGTAPKDVEAELTEMIAEIRDFGEELVVFLPDLHALVGKGTGTVDTGNLVTPALFRGELHVIGATTPEEYRRQIEKVPVLESRFQPVLVPEPTVEETVEILRGLRDRYEAHHQVRIGDDALVSATRLAHRYVPDRFLPDKAIDLIDRAGARAQLRTRTPTTDVRNLERSLERLTQEKNDAVAAEEFEHALELRDKISEIRGALAAARAGRSGTPEVGAHCVAEIVAQSTGIQVEQLVHSDRTRLQTLEDELRARVIGQDDAIAVVAEAIRRSRAGLTSPTRPIGSFLFLGPTGVGKTELARALAHSLFGGEDRLVRLDLSGFTDAVSAARLIGAPLGYTGNGEAGYLTEAVRRRPYSVLLLDQVDKVHADVFSTLLQVLDEGRLVDGIGRTVDFRNTVVVMTSSVAAEILSTSSVLGFAQQHEDDPNHLQNRVLAKLRERFRPEFLNRLDEIVVFRPLDTDQLRSVTSKLLEETRELLRNQDITIEFRPAALDWLTERGQHPQAGARRMRRTIQREVDNRLSALLLDGRLTSGQHVTVQAVDGQPELTVSDGIAPGADRF